MRLHLFRGRWHVTTGTGGDRQRISLRTADRDLAERRLADLQRQRAEIAGGTIGDLFAAYIADRKRQGKPVDTANHSWKSLRPHFAALVPAQVTREACRAFAEARQRAGRKDGTVIRDLGVLRAALRWHSRATPAVFEMPATPAPREIHITRDEFIRLRQAAGRTPHLAVFVELAKSTGARAGAILDLTWSRVDFVRGLIRLGPDVGNKRRPTVPMGDTLRAVLEEAQRAALSPYVVEFSSGQVGSVKTAFRRAARDIGRPDIGPHTIRHSVAVWMAEDGISMAEIAQYLGHSSVAMTERVYARFSPTFLRRAAKAVDF